LEKQVVSSNEFFHKDFKQDYSSSFLFASTAYIMRQVSAKFVQMSFSIKILREKNRK